ncbi:hypothetical protein C6495_15210 [Candidatus Poribacteria bacterium]|nr:MAG: hypothetical protein C6495_15210 [Candidatus Poribacteria bacterium]
MKLRRTAHTEKGLCKQQAQLETQRRILFLANDTVSEGGYDMLKAERHLQTEIEDEIMAATVEQLAIVDSQLRVIRNRLATLKPQQS